MLSNSEKQISHNHKHLQIEFTRNCQNLEGQLAYTNTNTRTSGGGWGKKQLEQAGDELC